MDNIYFRSIILNALLFIVFLIFIEPVFETNDDVAIMGLASGSIFGEPSEFLIYVNVILGMILKKMYIVFPSLNWYVILLYLLHFIALVIFLSVLLRYDNTFFTYMLYILFFVVMVVPLMANLNWTTTAFAAGSCGFLLFYLRGDILNRKSYLIILIIGILLVFISGLIRLQVFFFTLILWCPLILFKSFEKRFYKILIPVLAVLFMVLIAHLYHTNYYQKDQAWSYYLSYNSMRAKITDYPYFAWSDSTQKVYQEIGWSENDVALFRNWSYADQNKFTFEDLSFITSRIKVNPERNIKDVLLTLSSAIKNTDLKRGLFFAIVIVTAYLFIQAEQKKYFKISLLTTSAVLAYLAYAGRLPPWVFMPLLFYVSMIALVLIVSNQSYCFVKEKIISSIKGIQFLGFSVYLLFIVIVFIGDIADNKIKSAYNNHNYILNELASGNYIYAMGAGVISNRRGTLSLYNTYLNQNLDTLLTGGWLVPTPFYYAQLKEYSIDNVYLALLKEDILIIPRAGQLDLLSIFMQENYHISVEFEPEIKLNSLVAYQVKEIDSK